MLNSNLSVVFLSIAVVFLAVTLRDVLKAEGKLETNRKIWINLVLIFSSVAIGLYVLNFFE